MPSPRRPPQQPPPPRWPMRCITIITITTTIITIITTCTTRWLRRRKRRRPETAEELEALSGLERDWLSGREMSGGRFVCRTRLIDRSLTPDALAGFDLDARAFGEAHDRPPKRAYVLLRELHPMENVAQIAPHAGLLGRRPKEAILIEFRLEIIEESEQHLAPRPRGRRARDRRGRRRVAVGRLEPFVAAEQNRLGEIERGVG